MRRAQGGEYRGSPLHHVLNLIPQGHEKPMKHAFYNAVALLLLMFCMFIGYALFFVLEPFVKPLFWALLCGSVLHPFKKSLSEKLKTWLDTVNKSCVSLIIGIAVAPAKTIISLSDYVGYYLKTYIYIIAIVGISVPFSVTAYHYTPKLLIWPFKLIGCQIYNIINFLVGLLTLNVVITSIIGQISFLVWCNISGHQEYRRTLTTISWTLWFAVGCFMTTCFIHPAPIWNVSTFIIVAVFYIAGIVFEIYRFHITRNIQGSSNVTFMDSAQQMFINTFSSQIVPTTTTESSAEVQNELNESVSPDRSAISDTPDATMSTDPEESSRNTDSELTSSHYLLYVFWACLAVVAFKNMWVLALLPVLLLLYVIKILGSYFRLWSIIHSQISILCEKFILWCEENQQILIPAPVNGLYKISVKLSQATITALSNSIDATASIVVILLLLIILVTVTTFIAVKVYGEAVHLVHVFADIFNHMVVKNPELLKLLPEGIDDMFGQMVEHLYHYVRDGISSMIRGFFGSDDNGNIKAAQLEKQLLQVWDKVYQSWNTSTSNETEINTKGITETFMFSWDSIMNTIMATPELFNLEVVTDWVKSNLDTLSSLLQTVCSLLSTNINLIFGSFTAIISLVFYGGSAIFNFLLSSVVYFTALFYLLNSSGVSYKPVEIITQLSSSKGNRFANAFEASVNGVLTASLKMALFYGMWTWLIHNIFQVKMVYLPSVLAAILGAVPFLGTYWACIPAIIDLYLAQERGIEALLLFICQLMPMTFVDTAIYSEIRGGAHPYLTGLSIAGGILCLGAQGAIIGPLLLCCLFVAVNMSSSLMNDTPSANENKTIQSAL